MLDRRCGDGEGERSGVFSESKRPGDIISREDQKSLGEAFCRNDGGEEFSVYGEDSRETIAFCVLSASASA